MKRTLIASLIALAGLSFNTQASSELVNKAQAENQQQAQHNVARESGFKQTEKELKALKAQLIKQRDDLQTQNDKLAAKFSDNENTLARLEEKLRLETGSLGEVFGVVRQNAKELESELQYSVTSADAQTHASVVNEIVAATKLPSMYQLNGLWKALEEQIKASGEVASTEVRFVNGDGVAQSESALRLGSIGLVGAQGYLNWNAAKGEAQAYIKQPEQAPTISSLSPLTNGQVENIVLDPSRGVMLEQLAHSQA